MEEKLSTAELKKLRKRSRGVVVEEQRGVVVEE